MKLLRLPGLIDSHVHLRDPGSVAKEDLKTGTKAAIAGGFTAVCDMPNNSQPTTTYKRVQQKINLAQKKALCPLYFYLGADQDNSDEFKKSYPLVKGLKVYLNATTGPLLIEKLAVMQKIFKLWPGQKPILVHAEDEKVALVIGLVACFKKKVHFLHISQKTELEMIIKAKKQGLPITCEVTPHHLFMDESWQKKLTGFASMKPSLKNKKDVAFLWDNLKYIDTFGTDHAPHTIKEKKSNNPPFGVPGLETALPLLLTAVNQKKLTLDDIIKRFHTNPKKIFDIDQDDNTFIEVDLKKHWTIKNKELFTKCAWSPFDGWNVKGKVIRVFIEGKKVFENNKFY